MKIQFFTIFCSFVQSANGKNSSTCNNFISRYSISQTLRRRAEPNENRTRSASFLFLRREEEDKYEYESFRSTIGCSRRADAALWLCLWLCAAVALRRIGMGRCIWLHDCSHEFQKSERLNLDISKDRALWEWIGKNGTDSFDLSFTDGKFYQEERWVNNYGNSFIRR